MPSPREEFRAGVYALVPAILGGLPFGLIAGVAGAASGLTVVQTIASSAIIFSGIAQLMVYQLYGSNSPTFVILLATLVVGLRLIMYSAALAPHFSHLSMSWKLLLAFFTTDHGFAASIIHFKKSDDIGRPAWFHLGGGISQWLAWQIFVLTGAVLGAQVPASWSLDFAVPLSFLAMLIPAIKDRGTATAAGSAGITALLTIGLPFRLSIIVAAITGVLMGLLSDRKQQQTKTTGSKPL